jgi:hypothetical protein
MSEEARNYVVIQPCGCLSAAAHINPNKGGKELLREVSKWIKAGENVQQMSTEEIRSNPWGCEICRTERAKKHSTTDKQPSLLEGTP